MSDEIKLAPEELDRVKGVIAGAYERMGEVSRQLGGQSASVRSAYNGGGSHVAEGNFEDLGNSGRALADALDALSVDVGITTETGREMDADALGTFQTAASGVGAPDQGVMRAI